MQLHYSDTHERVQVGDQTIAPNNAYIKILAIYEHSGAILIEMLDGGMRRRRGATADEIGADWRGGTLLERDTARYFSKLPANEFYTSTPTGRLHDPKPETQHLHASSVLTFRGPYSPATDFAALELRLMHDESVIIPIDEADRQRLLAGLDLLLSMDTLAGQPERDAEQKAIQELATRLGKV